MRITNLEKGDGPEVAPRFNRGDSWDVIDGPHSNCSSRQVVQGVGVRFIMEHGQRIGVDGLLLRCGGCAGSYVLSEA